MESESSFIARQLRYFSATLYAQIKLSTRDGVNDIAKTQEASLINLINLAYNKKFMDLNNVQRNFKGLDYGDYVARIGLQMTATVTKAKFINTVNKITEEPTLKNSFPNIVIFLLTVEPVPSSVAYITDDLNIQYITLFDMVSEVLSKDLSFQSQFLQCLKKEYAQYFNFNPATRSTYLLNNTAPLPQDLLLINDIVETDEWFSDNVGEGYLQVYNFINLFVDKLSNCSLAAREILLSILQLADHPLTADAKIYVYLDVVYGRLNITPENEDDFQAQLRFLSINDLIEIQDDYQGYHFRGEDVIFENRKVILLNFNKYEPAMNLYSTLMIFCSKHRNVNDLEQMFTALDFSILSDGYLI